VSGWVLLFAWGQGVLAGCCGPKQLQSQGTSWAQAHICCGSGHWLGVHGPQGGMRSTPLPPHWYPKVCMVALACQFGPNTALLPAMNEAT